MTSPIAAAHPLDAPAYQEMPERVGGGHPRTHAVAQVRGVLAERVVVSIPLDPFLPVRALASYSGLSVRKLRECLGDPLHPLPHYRVGGKILVRRSEFDAWMVTHRQHGRPDVAKSSAMSCEIFSPLTFRYGY